MNQIFLSLAKFYVNWTNEGILEYLYPYSLGLIGSEKNIFFHFSVGEKC